MIKTKTKPLIYYKYGHWFCCDLRYLGFGNSPTEAWHDYMDMYINT